MANEKWRMGCKGRHPRGTRQDGGLRPRAPGTLRRAGAGGVLRYEELAGTEPRTPARDDLALDEVAWLLYTSGSSGVPKGVLSTQRNRLALVATGLGHRLGLGRLPATVGQAEGLRRRHGRLLFLR
ncbi:AMP-binding protein [Streptomyces sp. NPDC005151]